MIWGLIRLRVRRHLQVTVHLAVVELVTPVHAVMVAVTVPGSLEDAVTI